MCSMAGPHGRGEWRTMSSVSMPVRRRLMARRLSVVALRSPRTRVWFVCTCPWILSSWKHEFTENTRTTTRQQ